MPKDLRQNLLMVFLGLLITTIIVVAFLAALGPQIGNVFSDISMDLDGNGGGTSINTPVSVPQLTPTPTRDVIRNTSEATVTQDAMITESPMTVVVTVQEDDSRLPTEDKTPSSDGGNDSVEYFPTDLPPTPTPPSRSVSRQPPNSTLKPPNDNKPRTHTPKPLDTSEPALTVTNRASGLGDVGATATLLSALPTTGANQLPDTSTQEPTLVAMRNVTIVDVSGDVIGDGTLKVYNPERVDFPNSARVELELNFDNKYITPTPFGQVTSVAVTQVTSTPRAGQPTPTEKEPAYAVSGVQFNQLMGASLICLDTQFDGCDDEPNPDDVQLITLAGRTWTWTIKPLEDASGYQDLSIELWKVQEVNGREVTETLWNYGFKILVNEAPVSIPILWLIIGGGGLGVASIFAYAAWLNWRKRVQAAKPRPKAFISYRRSTSWAAARTIHDRLTEYGADVFIDVEDINDGRFAGVITDAIQHCDFFILVLAPGSLDSDWVIKEAQHALQHDKRIIPVLVDGFDLYSGDLPVELKDITAHNAIKLTPEFFNAGIDRIAKFMNLIIP